ncbi:MAG: IS66 family transposase [Acidiferrobacterales bacterium]
MNELDAFSPDTLAATPVLVQEALRRMQESLRALTLKNEQLTYELAYLKRIRFGRTSETLNAEQRLLFEDDLDGDLGAVEAESAPLTRPATTRARAGRQTLPAHLARIEVRHEPESCSCPRCQADLVQIGLDVHEQLTVEPARFFVLRHIRPQYACRQCETVTAAPVAPAVIDGGLAAPGLLAWVAVGKYLDHLPLYRLEQISARAGVSLSRSTMSAWIGRMGAALSPLVDRLRERLRQGSVLHADETPVQQLDPGSGKTRRGYLWSYRSNDLEGAPPIVVFDYQISRSGQHVARFLEGWRGALMVDDYGGYKALFGPDITELACLAHARRKFFDLHVQGGHPVADEALARIARLYAIEDAGRTLDIEERGQLRAQSSLVELQALHDWLIQQRLKTAHGSALARAIDYTLKRWPALLRYAQSGHLPIDNNPVENAIRPIAIGKKNWLFAGSERAGRRAATLQSLFATAKLNGIEPAAWLKDTLEKLPVWPHSRIDELLPLRENAQPAGT